MRQIFFYGFSFSIFCLSVVCCHAQYKRSVGLRLGSPTSISLKLFANESLAFEAYAGLVGSEFLRRTSISGALQIHKPLEFGELKGLSYYLGGGGTLLLWNNSLFDGRTTSYAVQGYAGLDYAFGNLPLNLSIDWIPTYFFGTLGISSFGGDYGALSIRYIFGR